MSFLNDHISICICTYKRPELLTKLLLKFPDQITNNVFSFSIIVVDNDANKSALNVVNEISSSNNLDIKYFHEKRRSISHARNLAVNHAEGNFIAFIDDDEFPEETWLIKLYETLKKENADAVLGPVKPHFDGEGPKWLVKSGILERDSFPTGEIIVSSKYTRTGNVLILSDIFHKDKMAFDPKYGVTGGGDAEFFGRYLKLGKKIVWCNEANVFETVPLSRQQKSYYIKRAFTRGMGDADRFNFFSQSTLKSITAVIIYTLTLPFLLLRGQHVFIKFLVKECDHLGKLLAYIGVRPVKVRPY